MRIKKLELCGFKSFKDRTVIHFDAGITGVVGPNGCGKSNIVDALVWVMGEQSAKHLRGSSMEDVIFGGAEGYAPAGFAEVSLTLENDGGPFPVKYARFSEIQATRRLHRSGESEYLINREPSRLRDIQEIFMDTGAGAKGFSIVEQGAIGKIITSKPEDRRVLIEEAAGITKFKARKKESQRKLQATDQNLIRLADIVGELKRQLESLQRQAKRAERYRELKKQVEDIDLWLSSHRYKDLRSSAESAQARFAEAETRDIAGRSELDQMLVQTESARLSVLELEKQVIESQEASFRLKNEVQQKEMELQNLKFEVESAKRQAQMQGGLKQELGVRSSILEREVNELNARLVQEVASSESLRTRFEEQHARYVHVQKRLTEIDGELAIARRELVAVGQSEVIIREKIASLEARLEEVTQRESNSRAVLVELNDKKAPFEDRHKKLYNEFERERQMQLDIMKDVSTFEENLHSVTEQLVLKRTEVDTFKDRFNEVASRLYGLENLQANFEGFEEGVKHVMMWKKAQKETTVDGTVVDLSPVTDVIEVPAEFEVAMEAALGTRLQLILSENTNESLRAVDYLKEAKAGRSSFYAPEVSGTSQSYSAPDGVVAVLKDVITSPERFKPSVERLLDRVAVVDSLKTALRLRSQHAGWTFVTTEGDVLSYDGVITGGSVDSADTGRIRRRREIKELTSYKEEWSGKLGLAQASLKKLESTEATLRRDLESAHRLKSEKEIYLAGLKKDLERAEIELQNLVKAVEKQHLDILQIESQRFAQETAFEDMRAILTEMQNKKGELERRSINLQEELDRSRSGIDQLRDQVTILQVDLATKSQEVEGLQKQREMLTKNFSDIGEQIGRMSEETEKNIQAMSSNQLLLEETRVRLERQVVDVEQANARLASFRNQFEVASAKLREIDDKINQSRRVQNELQSVMNESKLQLEQARLKEEYLLNQIRERYMIDFAQSFENYLVREGEMAASELELTDLRDKLAKIGEVNLSAIAEYDEITKRFEFLSQQQNDLLEAKEQLRKVIERINRICGKRFKETFEQVSERFQKVFPVLFGGGEARLILIESEEGEEGIDIVARPPGKKLQSVTLLSGGEKALSAVALIFSIFLVKPSPYCLLDEVDAPLDDANVVRLNDLIKEMAKRSQVIVVTHNKYTMEVTEKLYGVTMQEKGISKMVSVSLADARAVASA